jgi:UrcA family protein
MTKLNQFLFQIGSCALLISGASGAASAEGITVTGTMPSAAVSIADLNLSSHAGVVKLTTRIEQTAAKMCLTSAVEPLGTRVARSNCYRTAVSSGLQQVDRIIAAGNGNPMTAAATLTISAQ